MRQSLILYIFMKNHIFTAPREQCDNCGNQEAAGQLATDTTLITPLLLDYLDLPENGLESLRPEHVKPFLVKYLRWRVVYVSLVIPYHRAALVLLKECLLQSSRIDYLADLDSVTICCMTRARCLTSRSM